VDLVFILEDDTTSWCVGFVLFLRCELQSVPPHYLSSCHSSIAIIATSLILLLAMLLLMLFNSVHVCKVLLLTSCQRGRRALKDRPGQQCARANITFTSSQLHSACPIFKPAVLKVGHIASRGPHHIFYWATGE